MHGFVLVSLLVLLRQLLVYIYTGSVLYISAHHPRCLDTNSIEIIFTIVAMDAIYICLDM